tara:strand:+ start:744 stop:902 length:159 start_codon:yes stop_codon:yes gene_type:complete
MNINELSLFTIFFIIILIIGLYKTSKKILKRDNNNIIENLERFNKEEKNNGN